MVSLTLTPLFPWQAEQTWATFALPASMFGAAVHGGSGDQDCCERGELLMAFSTGENGGPS
jgi:hypothetical protein